jgi:hypothetical protein
MSAAADRAAHRTGDREDNADNEDQHPDRPHHGDIRGESDDEKNHTKNNHNKPPT